MTILNEYTIDLLVGKRTYQGSGPTFEMALAQIKPGMVKTKSVLRLKTKAMTREKILTPHQAQQLFSLSSLAQRIAFRNLKLTFGL